MIIARSPLRITLGGGGTDLPAYYAQHEGFLLAAAIDKYVYVTVTRPFNRGIFLKYSALEQVEQPSDVRHPIIREALTWQDPNVRQIEITSLADIPAGTGLGSSGSFTTALLKALSAHYRQPLHPQALAEAACHLEIERLREPIGKQDQYIAAYGGLTCLSFARDGRVSAEPLRLSNSTLWDLEDNLLLFFTGVSRSSSLLLDDQQRRCEQHDEQMLRNLHYIKELGLRSRSALEEGNLTLFGELLDEHWHHKRLRSGKMSTHQIDEWYRLARHNGACGGKLVGAGGGGFLMFYASDRTRLRRVMSTAGLQEVRFKFDFEGTKLVLT